MTNWAQGQLNSLYCVNFGRLDFKQFSSWRHQLRSVLQLLGITDTKIAVTQYLLTAILFPVCCMPSRVLSVSVQHPLYTEHNKDTKHQESANHLSLSVVNSMIRPSLLITVVTERVNVQDFSEPLTGEAGPKWGNCHIKSRLNLPVLVGNCNSSQYVSIATYVFMEQVAEPPEFQPITGCKLLRNVQRRQMSCYWSSYFGMSLSCSVSRHSLPCAWVEHSESVLVWGLQTSYVISLAKQSAKTFSF